jgi:hypothetical protein
LIGKRRLGADNRDRTIESVLAQRHRCRSPAVTAADDKDIEPLAQLNR